MADLSPPTSIFAFVTTWSTQASLFVFVNILIAALALASRFGTHNKPVQEDQHLVPAPSLLQRVKSIDYFSSYKFSPSQEPENTAQQHDPPQLERAPSLLERVKSINFSSLYYRSEPEETTRRPPTPTGFDADLGTDHYHDHHAKRSKSGHVVQATKKQQKMKRSASEKAVSLDLAEEVTRENVERRRPATTRASEKTVMDGDEGGVDAKADDFINRFKQQLKLQTLDSLLRYKERLKGKQKM
ncbi:hypothetical protein SADUNF_Sadunf06G0125600 [Salix dunnii]|uniref:DUF4408 domain-containing protein n=1 Tax=Salix dunnii TaxID=1413687 RepID=A0A835N0R1_9ROSI|nr:hypothetical protein SADUNF_Sadunf06G0125600 [Salix dunnii]